MNRSDGFSFKPPSGSYGWQNVSAIDLVSGSLITGHNLVRRFHALGVWVSAFLWGLVVVIHSNQQQSTTDAFDMQRKAARFICPNTIHKACIDEYAPYAIIKGYRSTGHRVPLSQGEQWRIQRGQRAMPPQVMTV